MQDPHCLVCGYSLKTDSITDCVNCETPHHTNCFDYNGGCAVYGCQENGIIPYQRETTVGECRIPGPRGSTKSYITSLLMVTTGAAGWLLALGITKLGQGSILEGILALSTSTPSIINFWQNHISSSSEFQNQ